MVTWRMGGKMGGNLENGEYRGTAEISEGGGDFWGTLGIWEFVGN